MRSEHEGWGPERTGARDTVLVCAMEPLRSALAAFVRAQGYQLRVSLTPLDAIGVLLDEGDRVCHAMLADDLPHDWARSLHEFIADEYPAIERIAIGARRGPPATGTRRTLGRAAGPRMTAG